MIQIVTADGRAEREVLSAMRGSARPALADLRDAFHSAEKDAGSQGKSDLV